MGTKVLSVSHCLCMAQQMFVYQTFFFSSPSECIASILVFYLFFFFWLHYEVCGILVPRPENPCPLQGKHRILITGLPGEVSFLPFEVPNLTHFFSLVLYQPQLPILSLGSIFLWSSCLYIIKFDFLLLNSVLST